MSSFFPEHMFAVSGLAGGIFSSVPALQPSGRVALDNEDLWGWMGERILLVKVV